MTDEAQQPQSILCERNTIDMVAAYWSCSPKHVRTLIDKGVLPAFKLGSLIRISREQIAACEAACDTKAKIDEEKQRGAALRNKLALERALETARRQHARELKKAKM